MPHPSARIRIRLEHPRAAMQRIEPILRALAAADPERAVGGVDDVLLALREVLANADRHGEARPVRLAVALWSGSWYASVRQRGRAYDPAAVPPPDPDAPREGGYGLFLLRRAVDRLKFHHRAGVNVVQFLLRAGATEVPTLEHDAGGSPPARSPIRSSPTARPPDMRSGGGPPFRDR